MADAAPPPSGDWGEARERARSQVREIFAATERECAVCGARAATRGRACPQCGAPYVARRSKRLATGRARGLAAAVAVVVLAVVGGAIALIAPGINHSKRLGAAAAARTSQAAIASLVGQEAASQRLHVGRGARGDPGARAPVAARLRARAVLVAQLEALIAADARARVHAGTLTGPVRYVSCSPYPPGSAAAETTLSADVGGYECVAVNRLMRDGHGAVIAQLGDPFWARIDFAHARMAWCKITPRPGEGGAGTGPPSVALAPACDLERGFTGKLP